MTFDYFCHSCDQKVQDVDEDDDGVLKCHECGEEYIEIIEPDNEQELNHFLEEKHNEQQEELQSQSSQSRQQQQQQQPQQQQIPFANSISNLLNSVINGFLNPNNVNNNNNNNNNNPNNPHPNVFINFNNNNNAFIFRNFQFSSNIFGDYAGDNDLNRIMQLLMERDLNHYGPPPASKSSVDNLIDIIYEENKENNKIEEEKKPLFYTECAICKDSYQPNEKLKEMPCQHRYHADCIGPWLKIHNTCPVCRYEMPTDDPVYEQIRQMREESTQPSSSNNTARSNTNQNHNANNNNNHNNNNNDNDNDNNYEDDYDNETN